MKDWEVDVGEERGKLFTLSLGVRAKLEFAQSKLRTRSQDLCPYLFSFNLTTNFVNVLFLYAG